MKDTLKEARIEHETLLRNPAYCLYLQMDELAMQQEPSLNQDVLPVETTVIYSKETPWSNRQWDEVQQLKSMVLYLQRKLNDSLKEKNPPSPPSYIYSSIKEESDTPDKREVN